MLRFLHSRAIGRPQYLAAGLLLIYLLQCVWLVRVQAAHGASADSGRIFQIMRGLEQWQGGPIAGTPASLFSNESAGTEPAFPAWLRLRDGFDEDHSALYYLTAAAPMLLRPASWTSTRFVWQLLAASPYLFFGVMLGGSLWYVARRLYGNAGGYIALTLYCFSPAMIVNVAGAQSLGEMGAVWGAFGAIWTAIAVAHTLYAPREVVLWNWRRILLLGLSVALMIGNQFSLIVLVFAALLLMLWVAPVRKRAVLVIWTAACMVGLFLIFAAYSFHPGVFWAAMTHARWLDVDRSAVLAWGSYWRSMTTIASGSAPLILALPFTLVVFAAWKRTRYFGNTAPLIIAVLLFLLGTWSPFPGQGFQLAALTFLFIFVAGIFTDLLETARGTLILAAVSGLLIASATWNLFELARAAR